LIKNPILVISPAPIFPTSAGNRCRILTICEMLINQGYAVDFAYYGHEDEIYRESGHQAPTDMRAMVDMFNEVFLIEPDHRIRVKTKSRHFRLDDWSSPQLDMFVSWYFETHPRTKASVVNYVFLSSAFLNMPADVVKIIDTHDKFADRQLMYNIYRGEPNFFYVDQADERKGLSRADIIITIQEAEGEYFSSITEKPVFLLPHKVVRKQKPLQSLSTVETIGFVGHGNDPNVATISHFAHAWSHHFKTCNGPTLKVAGEVCSAFAGLRLPGVEWLGYVDNIEDFYASVDLVVAPLIMGTGLKIKTVEALSFGKPVIGTKLGFEGLNPTFAGHTCETVDETIDFILSRRSDRAELKEICRASASMFDAYLLQIPTLEEKFVGELKARITEVAKTHPKSDGAEMAKGSNSIFYNAPLRLIPFNAGVLWQEESLDSRDQIAKRSVSVDGEPPIRLLGTLLATEKRPALPDMDNDQLALTFKAFRNRWFIGAYAAMAGPAIREEEVRPAISIDMDVFEREIIGASLVLAPDIRRRNVDAVVPDKEWIRLCAILLTSRPDWKSSAELQKRSMSWLEIIAMAPPRLLRQPDQGWGVLKEKVDNRTHFIPFTVERVWAQDDVRPAGNEDRINVRSGTNITIVPVGLRIRLDEPTLQSENLNLALQVGRNNGLITVGEQ
jgi:glycosyltransferase involved in cell wall biosynthesis